MGNFFFFKQKTAYEMRISDWSSDVCSSDLNCSRHGRDDRRTGRSQVTEEPKADAPIEPENEVEGGQHRDHPGRVHHPGEYCPLGGEIQGGDDAGSKIGRASCRESGCQYV